MTNFPCKSRNKPHLQKDVLCKRYFSDSILNDPFHRQFLFHFKDQLFPHLLSGISLARCSTELLFINHLLISTLVHTNLVLYICSSPRVSRCLLETLNETKVLLVCFNDMLREKTSIKIHTVQRDLNFRFCKR